MTMRSTTLRENDIPRLREMLKSSIENSFSDFYRKKYSGLLPLTLNSPKDFEAVPLLKKDEILETPVGGRTFVPADKVIRYSFSGGTLSHKKPSIIPFDHMDYASYHSHIVKEPELEKMGVRTVMVLATPLSPLFIKLLSIPREKVTVIPGDLNKLELMAMIAKEVSLNAIFTTPTALEMLLPHLREAGFDFGHFKRVDLGAEYCSSLRLEQFRNELYNATFTFRYVASESGVLGYQCPRLYNRVAVFHPTSHLVMEIIDENGELVEAEKQGSVTITDWSNKAFPLIRYKIQDAASMKFSPCECGESTLLTVGQRMELDNFRFHGVSLREDMVEAAISHIKEFIDPQFELHIFEEKSGGVLTPKLELRLQLKSNEANRELMKKHLEEVVSTHLFLGPRSTLKDLVDKKRFLPLTISFVEEWPRVYKAKRIISHLS